MNKLITSLSFISIFILVSFESFAGTRNIDGNWEGKLVLAEYSIVKQ